MSFTTSITWGAGEQDNTFRATHLWQELIVSFRSGMPCCRHRVKMRCYDDSFTGREAVEWLHTHLQTTGMFGGVTRQQALKLLQKFVQSDVIQEVRGKLRHFDEDNPYLYRFVTEPGPLNFIEDVDMASPRPVSPLGKRDRSHASLGESSKGHCTTTVTDYSGACFTNEYAFLRCDEVEEMDAGEMENDPMIIGTSPNKKCRSDSLMRKNLAVFDVNSQSKKLSPAQVATAWKEITLARILRLVDLPGLDGVLAHDAVDGKHIFSNVSTIGCKGRLSKTAARIRQSVPHLQFSRTQVHTDKRPPLPTPTHRHKLQTLTTTHHHKRRFSTKINSDSQSSTHAESVTDVPQWVVLAMKCLAKWPDGCTEEFVGGMPVYCGFELDVLQSLVKYFQALSDPLISVKLYDLHKAVHNLLINGKPGVTDALQLCSLLLPQSNRTRLHRILRLIYKASTNPQLHLSKTQSNKDVLLGQFASIILRSDSKLSRIEEEERRSVEKLVSFMAQHYQQIFKVPDDMKKEVQKRLDAISTGKEDIIPEVGKSFCHRLTSEQYDAQSKSVSQVAILDLLDKIIADETMSSKEKKSKLKDFQLAYPELYSERFPTDSTTLPTKSRSAKKPQRHASFGFKTKSRPSPKSLFRANSDCQDNASASKNVILR